MEGLLDESVHHKEEIPVVYGGFWLRFVALLLDALVMAPVTFGLTFYNIISLKSVPMMIFTSIVGVAYKPFMEYYYGATLGKMAVSLKVVNEDFERANLQTILLRNVFHIVPTVVVALLSIGIYTDPEFESVTGFMEYSEFTRQFGAQRFVNIIAGLIVIIEAIMIGVDDQKRSWHDRIAKTYVIEK